MLFLQKRNPLASHCPRRGHPAGELYLLAQETPTFSSDVKVVNVLATVRDKHGQIVNNLTKDDFKLDDNGQPQSIHYFAKETDLPLFLGLLVDTSMSQRRLLDQERIASNAFLYDLMRVIRTRLSSCTSIGMSSCSRT